jgi:hypothetical protein
MTMTLMDLRTDAEDEARRVGYARALIQNGDEEALVQLEGEGAWIAFPRRPRIRRALAGRICLVWRIAFEDRSGRLVDARLVPVLADVDRGSLQYARRRRSHIWPLLRTAEDAIRARVEAACDEWASTAALRRRAFAAARLAREDAIARLPQPAHVPSQPGLFDRRSERAQQARAAMNDGTETAARDRVRSIDDSASIVRRSARLLLVLVP